MVISKHAVLKVLRRNIKCIDATVSAIVRIVAIWQVAELLSALLCCNGFLQIINSVITFIHDLHGGM